MSINGRTVKTVESTVTGGGNVLWRGLDDNDADVASGLYIYQIRTGTSTVSGVITVAR